ncbi:hypothetical protein PENTCL1PPCAC_29005, partial [Pristionchus entomophagus]
TATNRVSSITEPTSGAVLGLALFFSNTRSLVRQTKPTRFYRWRCTLTKSGERDEVQLECCGN